MALDLSSLTSRLNSFIPVTQLTQLKSFATTAYGNALSKVYSPGPLLVTQANSNPNTAVFNPPGINQVGDPRASSQGYWNTSPNDSSSLAAALGSGPSQVGGSVYNNNYGSLLIPAALIVIAVIFLFKRK